MNSKQLMDKSEINLSLNNYQVQSNGFDNLSSAVNFFISLLNEKPINRLSDTALLETTDFKNHYVDKAFGYIENRGNIYDVCIKKSVMKKIFLISYKKKYNFIPEEITEEGEEYYKFSNLEQVEFKRIIKPFRSQLIVKLKSLKYDDSRTKKGKEYLISQDSILLSSFRNMVFLKIKGDTIKLNQDKKNKKNIIISLYNKEIYDKLDDFKFKKSLIFSRWNIKFPYLIDLEALAKKLNIDLEMIKESIQDQYMGYSFQIKSNLIIFTSLTEVTKEEVKEKMIEYLNHREIMVRPEVS